MQDEGPTYRESVREGTIGGLDISGEITIFAA